MADHSGWMGDITVTFPVWLVTLTEGLSIGVILAIRVDIAVLHMTMLHQARVLVHRRGNKKPAMVRYWE